MNKVTCETKAEQAQARSFLIDGVLYETVRGGLGVGERLPDIGELVVVTKINAELIKPEISRVNDVIDSTPTGIFKIDSEIDGEYNVYNDMPDTDEYYVVTSAKPLADIKAEFGEQQAEVGDEDNVNSPAHYTQNAIEVIDIIAQTVAGYDDPFVGHCVGTATKYLNRAPYKNNLLEDLRKSAKYIEFAIEHLAKKEGE